MTRLCKQKQRNCLVVIVLDVKLHRSSIDVSDSYIANGSRRDEVTARLDLVEVPADGDCIRQNACNQPQAEDT